MILPTLVIPEQAIFLEVKMQEKVDEQARNTKWANWLLEELQRRTGRKDIEVTVSPYCSHDVLLSIGTDNHPIVTFLSAMQGDSQKVAQTLDYTCEMLRDWELTAIQHERAQRDCLPFYEILQMKFPHMELTYSIVDSGKHCVRVTKVDDKIVSYFDLWPQMTEDDVKRLISHIKELQATLHRENATYAEMSYWWN